MSRLARRAVIATKGGGAKTYADFQAHIATLATGGSVLWGAGEGAQNLGAGKYRTTAAPTTAIHVMRGSPWTQAYQNGGTISRVVQHAMPSQAAFDAQIAAGYEIYLEIAIAAPQVSAARDRNGYLSIDVPTAVANRIVTSLIYWDGSQIQQIDPFNGALPSPPLGYALVSNGGAYVLKGEDFVIKEVD